MRTWLLILLLAVVTGCGTKLPYNPSSTKTVGGGTEMDQREENLSFEQMSAEEAPKPVHDKALQLQKSPESQYDVVYEQNRAYIIITLGERNTAGYRIEVERVVKRGNSITVHAKEIAPPKGGFVAQVISYPLVIVAVDQDKPFDQVDVQLKKSEDAASGGTN
jgi:hypothetical protein